jgi:hypothetical protein
VYQARCLVSRMNRGKSHKCRADWMRGDTSNITAYARASPPNLPGFLPLVTASRSSALYIVPSFSRSIICVRSHHKTRGGSTGEPALISAMKHSSVIKHCEGLRAIRRKPCYDIQRNISGQEPIDFKILTISK